MRLSARAYDRILKVFRTNTDLAGTEEIKTRVPGRSHPISKPGSRGDDGQLKLEIHLLIPEYTRIPTTR
jgi:hypothetical protein